MKRKTALAAIRKIEPVVIPAEDLQPITDMKDAQKVDKWVKLLRSGKYEQGYGSLVTVEDYDDNLNPINTKQFCCLGVYCNVIARKSMNDCQRAAMPDELGVNLPISKDAQSALALFNDSKKSSFNRIADIIEAIWLTAE